MKMHKRLVQCVVAGALALSAGAAAYDDLDGSFWNTSRYTPPAVVSNVEGGELTTDFSSWTWNIVNSAAMDSFYSFKVGFALFLR